jgi:hypothetical protein
MKPVQRVAFLLIAIVSISGCSETTMKNLNDAVLASQQKATVEPTPEPGKAMVVFMNNFKFSNTKRSFLYDGENYIDMSVPNTKFAYQAAPGKHLFMIVSANAGFMGADLEAGKTYYAEIRSKLNLSGGIDINPETGHFRLQPYNGMSQDSFLGRNKQALLDQIKTLVVWAKPLDETTTARWNKVRDAIDIKAMKEKYLPEYEAEGEDKPYLLKISGS